MANAKEKKPKTVPVSDAAARLWSEEGAPVAAALFQLRQQLAAAESRLVRRMAAKDGRDLRRWGFNPETMEWFEVPEA